VKPPVSSAVEKWKFRFKNLAALSAFEFEGMKVKALVAKEETEKLSCYHIAMPRHHSVRHAYHKKAHEIVVVLEGRGTVRLGKRKFALRRGDCVLIAPRTWHSFSTAGSALKMFAFLAPRVDAATDFYYK
jgi:mannose-6-phosphate isomerase-like protein (cupin superfamily)